MPEEGGVCKAALVCELPVGLESKQNLIKKPFQAKTNFWNSMFLLSFPGWLEKKEAMDVSDLCIVNDNSENSWDVPQKSQTY